MKVSGDLVVRELGGGGDTTAATAAGRNCPLPPSKVGKKGQNRREILVMSIPPSLPPCNRVCPRRKGGKGPSSFFSPMGQSPPFCIVLPRTMH